jgi:hypothetical protein
MKHTFLITTAAAALLAGTAVGSAQVAIERQAPAASEQKAVPEVKSDVKVQSKDQKAQIKADEKLNAQAPGKAAGAKSETSGQAAPSKDIKVQDTQKSDTKAQGMQKQDSAAPQNAQTKSSSDSKTTVQSDTKSGTAASASVSLNAEQKTRIRETVIKSSNAPRVTNVNFSVSIGTTVPKTVRFAPLPSYLVEIQPSWRGYEYFLVGDEIVVVDPRTLRIVAVLDV